MSLKRRLGVIVAAGLLALSAILPSSASAYQVSTSGSLTTITTNAGVQSCSQAYLILWEHVGYNGRGLRICYGVNIPNLAAYGFNDITSSAQYREPGLNTTACVYTEPSYVITLKKFTVPEDAQWFLFGNDAISSTKFGC